MKTEVVESFHCRPKMKPDSSKEERAYMMYHVTADKNKVITINIKLCGTHQIMELMLELSRQL